MGALQVLGGPGRREWASGAWGGAGAAGPDSRGRETGDAGRKAGRKAVAGLTTPRVGGRGVGTLTPGLRC